MTSDLRYAIRSSQRNCSRFTIALSILTIGIGANAAIFGLIQAALLRPLSFFRATELYAIWAEAPSRGVHHDPMSLTKLEAFQRFSSSFTSMSGANEETVSVSGRGEPVQIIAERVTWNFFTTIGIRPILGRNFAEQDDKVGGDKIVILSHSIWMRLFAADPNVMGTAVQLDGVPHTVIGVLPNEDLFPFEKAQIWRPRPLESSGLSIQRINAGAGFLNVIGRLRPGVGSGTATEELRTLCRRYGLAFPDNVDASFGTELIPLQKDLVADIRPGLLLLLMAVMFLLLIACANIANLFLATQSMHEAEIAVRIAMGASRRRIIWQIFLEVALVAALAAILGLFAATWIEHAFANFNRAIFSRQNNISLKPPILFTACICLIAVCLIALGPCVHAIRINLARALLGGTRGRIGSGRSSQVRNALIVVEVTLSIILLTGATLLALGFRSLHKIKLGFTPEHVFTTDITLSHRKYEKSEEQIRFFERLILLIKSLPGVTGCGAVRGLPFSEDVYSTTYTLSKGTQKLIGERPLAIYRTVTADYFEAMQIPLVKGRYFDSHDDAHGMKVLLVDRTFSKKNFGDDNAVGRSITVGVDNDTPYEIIGVLEDVRSTIKEISRGEIFLSAWQRPVSQMTVVARASCEISSLNTQLREAVRTLDSEQPSAQFRTMSQRITQLLDEQRFVMRLVGTFAIVALAVTATGVYGIVSYTVSQRLNEIGIRVVLGADRIAIHRLIVGQNMRLVCVGTGIGIAGATGLTHSIDKAVYGLAPLNLASLAFICVLLASTAFVASFIPVHRALQTNPAEALRSA